MKKQLIISLLAVSSFAMISAPQTAFAGDGNSAVQSGFLSASYQDTENIRHCFHSDLEIASSRAIRACSKSYKNSIPNAKLRSDILTRRGLLQLSAGRFDKASRDFKSASRLNNVNELASLGEGFVAVMQNDLQTAETLFQEGLAHGKTKSLAMYGLGIVHEMTGNNNGALSAYQQAANLEPNWKAPHAEIKRLKNL